MVTVIVATAVHVVVEEVLTRMVAVVPPMMEDLPILTDTAVVAGVSRSRNYL